MEIVTYKEDIKHGKYIRYYEDGKIAEVGRYFKGEKTGRWKGYRTSGSLSYSFLYFRGRTLSYKIINNDDW